MRMWTTNKNKDEGEDEDDYNNGIGIGIGFGVGFELIDLCTSWLLPTIIVHPQYGIPH